MSNVAGKDSGAGIEMFGTPDSQLSDAPGFGEDDLARSFFVRALYDFRSGDSSSLSFTAGAVIEVLTQLESGWWDGLMGNDVRGWFPSNYVEVITDEEAEAEMELLEGKEMTKEGLPEGSSTQYTGLGLGQDFDILQQLMTGMTSNDAFEQLAEAGMREPNQHHGEKSGEASAVEAKKASAAPRLGPSERERMRAHSASEGSGEVRESQGAGEGRPRAATNSSMAEAKEKKRSKRRDESDFWVPRVTERGEIVYYNTRTGAQSHDLPDRTEMGGEEGGSSTPSSMAASDEESGSDQSVIRSLKSPTRRPTFGRHTSTIYADSEGNRSRAVSDSRPSTATSHLSNATMKSRRNGIENMPDPQEVPWPWVVRASDDEKTFYFFNRQTGELSQDCPLIVSEATSMEEMLEVPRRGPRKSRATTLDSSEHSAAFSRDEEGTTDTTASISKHADERDARELQLEMANGQGSTLHLLIDEASNAIGQLASTASEPVAADGLSDEDRLHLPATSTLVDSSRLGEAIRMVVDSVRDLLYAAGSLAVNAVDLAVVSELAGLVQDEASFDVLLAFQGAMSALHGRGTLEVEPHIAVALQQATQPPPAGLTPLGKKINATLSKLVLSARSVIEQSCLNTSIRPELSPAQLDKITSYRQRIKDDSMELARALGAFGVEADRSRVALGGAAKVPWVKQVQGVLKSGRGTAGIGLNVLGGGAAAGWRGNGFVLPSATEAAALRAEAMGSYQNPFELTKSARNALSSGKISLRRKPTVVLSKQLLDEQLAPPFSRLDKMLSTMGKAMASGVAEGGNGRVEAGDRSVALEAQVKEVLSLVGSVLISVEEMDLATCLDVDGPEEGGEEYLATVVRARKALHQFTSVKQDVYDLSSLLFLESQEVVYQVNQTPGWIDDEAGQLLTHLLKQLQEQTQSMYALIAQLVTVSEEQGGEMQGLVGARSKVYGIDEVKISTQKLPLSAPVPPRADLDRASSINGTTDEQEEEQGDDVMYLGPGLAVPNGPPSSARSPSATLKPSVPDGLRARSTSVTTGASTNSHDSGPPVSLQRAGTVEEEEGEGARGQVKVNSKIKRFFGDDAPLQPSAREPASSGSTATAATSPATLASTAAATGEADSQTTAGTAKAVEQTPWFLEVDYSPEDIVMNANGQVKGATLGALMERLTLHNAFDSNFNTTFLMTYRSFTTTVELLDMLSARFRIREPQGLTRQEHKLWEERKQTLIRFRIFNVLKTWLESHFYEGEDEIHLRRIEHFVLDGMGQSPILAKPGSQLIRLIERRAGKGEPMVRMMKLPASTPGPILPRNFRKIKFLDIDPLEMARQLTLIDSRLYNLIRPVECLGKAWSREDGAQVAKGIRDVISANNKVSGWVSEAILVQEDLKKRAAWVKQFVAIADRCHALNNFSSMMAIYSGLNNASLNRLRRTWDAVNQRHLMMFENMKNLLAPTKNFSKYRETLRMLNPPCVPFLGVYLTDLTFIEDGNSDRLKTDERLINFSKRQMTADKIQEIMIYQSTPYNLTPVSSIQKFIEENLIDSRRDAELFEQSLRLEPREREDEKIARLLQESGFL